MSTYAMDGVKADDNFCCKHKLKIWGSIIAIILVAGVVGSIIVVITYATKATEKDESCDASCLKFTQTETCFATEATPYRNYGTKTNYNVSKAEIENATVATVTASECKPVFFYLLSRHAIRYPDQEEIEEMQLILPDLQARIKNSSLCVQDVENLKQWRLEMKPEEGNQITPSGLKQAENIGMRFKEMVPSLLNDSFTAAAYEFGVTSKTRTRDTAKAFAKGLFGKDIKEIQYPVNDTILHFNSICSRILKEKNNTSEKPEEVVKFRNGSLLSRTLDDISMRLGFNVTYDEADKMFFACAFGYAINQTYSPWCSVFTVSNIKVFEYYFDLDDYYGDAYGNSRNYQQACPLIKDMVEQLRKAKEGTPPARKALMYFSHSGVMKKVFSHLGIYQDSVPLKADDLCCSEDRKWRSSIIAPFNANLAVVLYNCGEKFSVEAYLQEKPLIIGGCKTTLCPWEDFEKHYVASSDNCDLQKICVP